MGIVATSQVEVVTFQLLPVEAKPNIESPETCVREWCGLTTPGTPLSTILQKYGSLSGKPESESERGDIKILSESKFHLREEKRCIHGSVVTVRPSPAQFLCEVQYVILLSPFFTTLDSLEHHYYTYNDRSNCRRKKTTPGKSSSGHQETRNRASIEEIEADY